MYIKLKLISSLYLNGEVYLLKKPLILRLSYSPLNDYKYDHFGLIQDIKYKCPLAFVHY